MFLNEGLTIKQSTFLQNPCKVQTERFFMLQHFDGEYLYFSAVIMLCLCSAEVEAQKPLGYCEENIVLDGFVATETAGNVLDVTENG